MTPQEQSRIARDIAHLGPVIPVLVIEDAAHARPLAEALVRGRLPALEVTLRTPAALDAIAAMADVPGGVVGAGTLLTPEDVRAAKAAGARFGVSPGATDTLIEACIAEGLPLLPGAATAAEAVGGAAYLKSLAGPLPQVSFCPTGGVSPDNAAEYLSLPNVICAGGSWIAPATMQSGGDWAGIEALARDASTLG